MNENIIADIIEWDIGSWKKTIFYWETKLNLREKEYSCLELGSRRGGLSLWLSTLGNKVICSDLESPEDLAIGLHKKYNCEERISYQSIDATNIPYTNQFDIVIFKSILGGISRNGKNELKKKAIDEIYSCLKPGGKLLFAENLEASVFHRLMRKFFVKWGAYWNYLKYEEIDELFQPFTKVKYETAGYFAAFGRSERQRSLLCKIDNFFHRLIPSKNKYIVLGIAEK